LLGERDPVRRPPSGELPDVDLRIRLDAIAGAAPPLGIELDRSAVQRLRQETREWRRRLDASGPPPDSADAGPVLAWAYPDRIAARRSGFAGRFLLRNGRGASVPANQPLARADYLVAVELDDVGPESRILLAAPLEAAVVDELAARDGVRADVMSWDDESESVRTVERLTLGAIVLEERPAAAPDPDQVARVLTEAIARKGIDALPWGEGAIRLRQRLQFLHRQDPTAWPDQSAGALVDRLQEWLAPRLAGIRSFAELRARVDLGGALREALSPRQRAEVDRLAPDRWVTPAGSSLAIDYGDPAAPSLAVRIQELFGLADTPRVAGGRVPLTLELLSPARRPVQITRDLRGFWASSYFDVRKDLKGRYPKHPWPDNPLEAAPRRGR